MRFLGPERHDDSGHGKPRIRVLLRSTVNLGLRKYSAADHPHNGNWTLIGQRRPAPEAVKFPLGAEARGLPIPPGH